MARKYLTAFFICIFPVGLACAEHSPLLPRPQQVNYAAGSIPLADMTIVLSSSPTAEDRFGAAELSRILKKDTGIQLPIAASSNTGKPAILLDRTGQTDQPLSLPGDLPGPKSSEAYDLTVTRQGVKIHACSSAGIFHGIQTLRQLVEGSGSDAVLPLVEIHDWPSLAFRGTMVDISHGPLPTEKEIERQLEFLARWKANQYYLYTEDSIALKGYPLLNPDGRLTQDEVRRIVAYGGAGTSAYAGAAVARSWPGARALPTTDWLLHSREDVTFEFLDFASNGTLVSLARSGDSPESAGTISLAQRMFPEVSHLVIVCNEHGRIAQSPGATVIKLDPRTNDRGLAMTASFSNLVLAGMALNHLQLLRNEISSIADKVRAFLPTLEAEAQRLGTMLPERVVVLTPPDLAPLGQEAALKILELTSGKLVPMTETYLGLRHGPISFLRKESLVVCVESCDPVRRKYEHDLIRELQEKELSHIVLIGSAQSARELGVECVPAMASGLPDRLRTPFEVVFFQLLAHSLSMASGLDPDDPSRGNIITRVVRPFQLYERVGPGKN